MNKISVVVPCFNEEEVLSMFYKKTSEVLNEIDGITYELLFVDDGSKDHTKDILRALSLKDDRCEFVSFSRNFGKEAAMFAGLKKSSGDYVVIMDADLQHPPVLLKEMYKAVSEEGYDCCAGKRVDRTGEGKIRNFLSHTFYKVSVVSNDVAGGRSTITKKVPVSSLGTNPVGVFCIRNTRTIMLAMTVINVVTL